MKKIMIFLSCLILFGCPSDDDAQMIEEELTLSEVTYEVVFFEYTPDTGNMTSSLSYEIIFTNSNDVEVNGFVKVTTNADGLVTTLIGSSNSQCYTIDANSNCVFSFFAEDSHDLGILNSIELVSVEYTFEE